MVKISSSFLISFALGAEDQRFNVKDDCDMRKEICIKESAQIFKKNILKKKINVCKNGQKIRL